MLWRRASEVEVVATARTNAAWCTGWTARARRASEAFPESGERIFSFKRIAGLNVEEVRRPQVS